MYFSDRMAETTKKRNRFRRIWDKRRNNFYKDRNPSLLYFKQPKGIYKTLKGFSMGDNSAARVSEIILRIYELKIFEKIHRLKLEKNLSRFLRFRDDVSVHLTGEINQMLKVLKIITTGYPK